MKVILNPKNIKASLIQRILKDEYKINTEIYIFLDNEKESTIGLIPEKLIDSIPFWETILIIVSKDQTELPDKILWNEVCSENGKYSRIEDIDFIRTNNKLISIIEEEQEKETWNFDVIIGTPCVLEIDNDIKYEILLHGEFGTEYSIEKKTNKWYASSIKNTISKKKIDKENKEYLFNSIMKDE